jgi:chromosome segregation ATPase
MPRKPTIADLLQQIDALEARNSQLEAGASQHITMRQNAEVRAEELRRRVNELEIELSEARYERDRAREKTNDVYEKLTDLAEKALDTAGELASKIDS